MSPRFRNNPLPFCRNPTKAGSRDITFSNLTIKGGVTVFFWGGGGVGNPQLLTSKKAGGFGGLPPNSSNPSPPGSSTSFSFTFAKKIELYRPLCTCRIPSVNIVFTNKIKKLGGWPPGNCQSSYFLNGNPKFLKWKMGPFEKIVDQIRGVLNLWGKFSAPGLGSGPFAPA